MQDSYGFVAQTRIRPREPQPQTQLCLDRHHCRAPQLREAVEQRYPHMQFCDMALKRAGHRPLAQAFEAVHLGLHQAWAAVAASFLPDPPPQSLANAQRFIACARSHARRCTQPS